MCAIFGVLDYKGKLTAAQRLHMVKALGTAAEIRGTDATGMSGKSLDRPELKRMMNYVREGDVVIVESISRFARNTRDLLELMEQLSEKSVQFVSKKEAIDTSTPTGRFMLTVFGAVAELEREYILQRQKEGIAVAKEKGIYQGRKPIQRENFDFVVGLWQAGQITAVEAMKRLNLKSSTFYRRVRQMKGVC